MFDLLTTYLVGHVSPERMALYEQCYAILDKFEVPQFDQVLDELVMSQFDGSSDSISAIDKIDEFFVTALKFVLIQHGVVVNEDTPLSMLQLIVSGISDLAEYENSDEIAKVLAGHLNNEETFCELISLVIYNRPDELLSYVESVDINLFKRISFHIESKEAIKESAELLDTASREARIKAIQSLIVTTQNYSLTVLEYLTSGMELGFDYEVYADRVVSQLIMEEPESVAENLYACALASKEGFDKPRETVLAHIDKYVPNISIATKVNIRLTYLEATVER